MSSATRDENRLADYDRRIIHARLAEWVNGYKQYNEQSRTVTRYIPTWSDIPTAERVAAHSIGCATYDLRDSEMSEIRAIVLTSLGLDEEGER